MRKISVKSVLYLSLAIVVFAGAFVLQRKRMKSAAIARAIAQRIPDGAPDSAKFAAMGLKPGKQLRAYVVVSSSCGFCQDESVKLALRNLRRSLIDAHSKQYAKISVIGVSVDTKPKRGIQYFESVGMPAFDQVSSGDGWQNESAVHLLWRSAFSEALVPQVIVVESEMHGTAEPFLLNFQPESLLTAVRGRVDLLEWVANGVRLRLRPSTPASEPSR